MKTKIYTLLIVFMVTMASCSKDVYNNKNYLASHNLEGKTIAILPVEVYYTGNQPKNNDWYAQEQATSLELQSQVEQAYLIHTNRSKPKKHQQHVQLLSVHIVNDRLRAKMADLRTAWTLAPDSLGRMIDADLVFKVRMNKERYMSENLAKGINAGAFLLEGIFNSSSKNKDLVLLPRVKADDVAYEISLIDTRTGEVVSRYINDPAKNRNIRDINKAMAAQSAVYAAR